MTAPTQDERAGWLAQLVIDKLGGTNDLPAWVAQSARYYMDAQAQIDALRGQLDALQSLARDGQRYRKLRGRVQGVVDGYGRHQFQFPYHLRPREGVNVMRGSVAEHFDNSVDDLP